MGPEESGDQDSGSGEAARALGHTGNNSVIVHRIVSNSNKCHQIESNLNRLLNPVHRYISVYTGI